MSLHATKGVSCLDCHQPVAGQQKKDHHGFIISTNLTARSCRGCHEKHLPSSFCAVAMRHPRGPRSTATRDLLRSRSIFRKPISQGEHAGRPLCRWKGASAMTSGCEQCHSVGKPNSDGTIGTCTACHTRHTSSVHIVRLPSSCAQCHLGPASDTWGAGDQVCLCRLLPSVI